MFLKQVYKYNKWMFAAMILFIAGQTIINFNHGAVFSPLYLYGMYSGKMTVQKQYDVLLIKVNGEVLKGEDFSIQEWDKINLPVFYYLLSDSNNNRIIQIRDKMLQRLHLYAGQQKNAYFRNVNFSPERFMQWYQPYLERIIGYPITAVHIQYKPYNIPDEARGKLVPNPGDTFKTILPVWNSATGTGAK